MSVFLCHECTEMGIVIESSLILYMVLIVESATVRAQHHKNPGPYLRHPGMLPSLCGPSILRLLQFVVLS